MSKKEKSKAKTDALVKTVKALETVASEQKKKKKNKGKKGGFWSAASKGLGVATTLLPLVAPLLLKDHSSKNLSALKTVVGSAPIGISSQMTSVSSGLRSYSTKAGRNGMVESANVVGTEFLTNLVLPANAVAGSVLFISQINPVAGIFSGTRVNSLAKSYQRWNPRPGGMVMRFASSLPTTTSGQLAMVLFSDPATELAADGTDLIRQVTDAYGSDTAQFWSSSAAFSAPPVPNQPSLYVDQANGDVALYSAGIMVIITLSAGTGTDTNLGSVFLDYDWDLYQPTVEPISSEPIAYISGGTGGSSCTDAAPLGLGTPPVLYFDTIGIENLTGAGFDMPGSGSYQIIWEIVVGTSVTNSSTSMASINGVMAFLAPSQVAAASTYLRYNLSTETPGVARPIVFSLTGMTGETVAFNRVHIIPTVDFPLFDSIAPRVNARIRAVNDKCRAWSVDALARSKTNYILERVEQMLSHHGPPHPTPVQPPASLPSLASLELGWQELKVKK